MSGPVSTRAARAAIVACLGLLLATVAAAQPASAAAGIKAQYKSNDTAVSDNQAKPGLQIVNTGTTTLDLATVRVRYYFTKDTASALTWACDYAVVGCGNVRGAFGAVTPATPTADSYLELSLTGSLAPGASTGEIQNRINHSDWSSFDEANDYSHGTNTVFVDTTTVTVSIAGTPVWGTDPSGASGGDVTAPSVPTGLTVRGTTVDTASLSWAASTDLGGGVSYQVLRGTTVVGNPTTTSFTETALTAGTAYSYTVKARDTAGNLSNASTAVTATTRTANQADTMAPTVPAGLVSTGATSSSVSLGWTASTDDVAVTGYDVLRGTAVVGSSATTTFSDTTVAASTAYSYSVRARDAAGNVSAASAALSVTTPTAPAPSSFVSASGRQFMLDGKPFRYGGTNQYYLHYKSHIAVDNVLADAKAMHLSVVRAWGHIDRGSLNGAVANVDGSGDKDGVYFQFWDPAKGAPAYNDGATGLEHLDYLLAQANAKGIKIILTLTNNWKDFGGMDQYVTWYGLQYHDQFYTDARVKQAYKNWAAHLVNRVNTITGVVYKNDPAIFSWELGNEPRCINAAKPTSGTCTFATLNAWAAEMSTFIKSIDANHMVSVGDEGFLNWGVGSSWPYNGADGVDNEALTRLPNIAFGTYHLYPDGWGTTADWGTQWIKDHITATDVIGKPTILEEFGFQNKTTRDGVYQTWTQTVRTGGGAGWNFWLLSSMLENGQPYGDYDGFTVYQPSSTATLLANEATAIGRTVVVDPAPPAAPTGLTVTGVSESSITLAWTAAQPGTNPITGYDVYRGTTLAGTSTTTTFTDTGLTPSTAYSYTVRARDTAGVVSAASTAVTPTTVASTDTTAPTVPTGVTVTGTSESSVSLSWTASTDAGGSGLVGYQVFRGTTLVGSPTTTSFTNVGLTAGTAYSYTVQARDAAGNISAASTAVSATTTPATPPAGGVKVLYKNNDTAPADNQIRPGLQVVNTGTSTLNLTTVSLRYYFTGDGGTTYTTYCDYAAIGCANVKTQVVALTTPVAGADAYVEVTFSGGSLAAGANSGDIQLRFNKTNWSNFDETNDYSRGTNTVYADATKVTAYIAGALSWGVAPV